MTNKINPVNTKNDKNLINVLMYGNLDIASIESNPKYMLFIGSAIFEEGSKQLDGMCFDFAAYYIKKFKYDIIEYAFYVSDWVNEVKSDLEMAEIARAIEADAYMRIKRHLKLIRQASRLFGMMEYSAIHYNAQAISAFVVDVVSMVTSRYYCIDFDDERTLSSVVNTYC